MNHEIYTSYVEAVDILLKRCGKFIMSKLKSNQGMTNPKQLGVGSL
jgi:hypothetical protein